MKPLCMITGLRYRDYAPGLWQLTRPLVWVYDGKAYCAAEGFVTDFYSIPRFLRWSWQQNQGTDNDPSAIHDYLVRHRRLLGLSLMECHAQFRAAMKTKGFSWWRRDIKYSSVVAFNWTMAGPGDGTPPGDVLYAMAQHGEPELWKRTLPRPLKDEEAK